MKQIISLFLITAFFSSYSQKRKVFFNSPQGNYLISSDLHIHSVFSDGEVWPSIRVKEARRDSIDLISLTEHLEYLSYRNDIIIPDEDMNYFNWQYYDNTTSFGMVFEEVCKSK